MQKALLNCWFAGRWLLVVWLVALSGCGGCTRDPDEKLSKEELEKRAKERRESLEMNALVSIPSDAEAKFVIAKPGHWLETRQMFKSNREDLQIVAVNGLNRGSAPVEIPGTNFVNEYTRRTSLPKGQAKNIDLQCFVPNSGVSQDPLAGGSTRLTFRTELLSWPLMTPILQAPNLKPAQELKQHEYQLVVLGPNALAYKYMSVLDAVFWTGDDLMGDERTRSYQVSLVKPQNNRYTLPKSMLTMTAMAVVLWDDVSPDELSEAQKRALVDWLHWGGQIIVSGPTSWARLQNSFLSPYLPAAKATPVKLASEDFAAISDYWKATDLNPQNKTPPPIEIVGEPIAGLRFELSEKGAWLPQTGEMVAEAQVGRGRVVVTGFNLTDPQIFRWSFYSSFLSTGMLRRPPREMSRSNTMERLPAQFWMAPFRGSERNPNLHSNFRILSRDLPSSGVAAGSNSGASTSTSDDASTAGADSDASVAGDNAGFVATPGTKNLERLSLSEATQWGRNGGAWNDSSGLSNEALAALKSAAGIELPSKRTIMYLLAGYLALLVPVNWLFFKLIGRLEFAWIAAPVMALVGAVVVTKIARLDIGFARRTTEIAVLEMHDDYSRGHLTQYLALYTSLSTNYAIQFPENDSVALPLGDYGRQLRRAGSARRDLRTNYGRADGVTLEPLTVYSSSTEMVHSEQMVDLEGGLRLGNRGADGNGDPALKNDTKITLQAALILRCLKKGEVEMAWVGEMAPQETATLTFRPVSQEVWQNWESDPVTQSTKPEQIEEASDSDSLWIGGVLDQVVRKTPLWPGQHRLFAYTNDRLSQLSLDPQEDQYDGRCIVVAHLTPMKLGVPSRDKTIKSAGKPFRPSAKELDDELSGVRKSEGETQEAPDAPADAKDPGEVRSEQPRDDQQPRDEQDPPAEVESLEPAQDEGGKQDEASEVNDNSK